jgi:hypothetical protein
VSKAVFGLAYVGSGSFVQALAAAVLTFGSEAGLHGPTLGARKLLVSDTSISDISDILASGRRVPGFGNSFFKNEIDPAFKKLAESIASFFPKLDERILELAQHLYRSTGTRLYPNAAMYTAAVCEICECPAGKEFVFLGLPRIPVWAEQMCHE